MKRRTLLSAGLGALAASSGLIPLTTAAASTSDIHGQSPGGTNPTRSREKHPGGEGSLETVAADVQKQVLDVFTYEEDTPTEVGDEPWNSFARTVRNGEPFVGDCDDFALTCAELLLARGVPADEVHVITCYTETGVYHAVALAGDWVLDNRHRSVRSRGAVPYRWKLAMRLDQPGRWRKFSSSA